MSEPVITVRQMSRHFGNVRALSALDLDVPAGIIFGFLGPNGAGKTTTIRLLLGLLEPTSGHATVMGHDCAHEGHRIREYAGALLEQSGLYERLSAEDNLDFYGRVWRMSVPARRARIRALLEPLGLFDRRRELVGTWSRGMKQRLAVARALFHSPRLVFLDEPTAGLDPVAASAVREDLLRLVEREGVTVFLTTHNLAEAERLCARVAVVKAGRLVATGRPDELRAANRAPVMLTARGVTPAMVEAIRRLPGVRAVSEHDGRLRVDGPDGASAAPVVALLVQAGAAVEEVRRQTASLETVFLTLMEEEPC